MMENLKTIRLSKIASVQTGPFGSQLHKEDYVDVGTPIITVEHLGGFKIGRENLPNVSEADKDRLRKYTLHEGDTVFSRVGSVDRCSYVTADEDGWLFSGRCLRLRVSDGKTDPRFLYYALTTPEAKDFIRAVAVGATMPSINTQIMGEVEIPDFPLPIQIGIAEVLGSLDDKIAANEIVISRCEGLIQTIALTASNSTRLGDLARRVTKATKPSEFEGNTVLHYSLPAYDRGFAELERVDSIKSNKFAIENPCVLVSKLNPNVPRAWCVPKVDEDSPSVASTEFVVLEPLNCSVGQLYAASIQPAFFKHLESLTGGTSKSHQRVLPEEMLESEVPDTRTLEADEIALLDSLVLLQQKLVEENVALARTRDELLPLLMSKRITVAGASRSGFGSGVEG